MLESSSVNCVIYHADCTDGFGSAYAAWKLLGNRAEYHACKHGQTPPDVKDKVVIIQPFGRGINHVDNTFVDSTGRSIEYKDLKSIIITEIESYYLKFKNENCSFLKRWPSKYDLAAWHVILKKQGHQNPHIHPSGWLSGVIYLKVVPSFKKNEGAIEFSLNGEKYYDAESPKVLHLPKTGDIVIFPSSLHHRTIPFSADTDRISIAFDLVPNLKKGL